jgi:hypothetical protein
MGYLMVDQSPFIRSLVVTFNGMIQHAKGVFCTLPRT